MICLADLFLDYVSIECDYWRQCGGQTKEYVERALIAFLTPPSLTEINGETRLVWPDFVCSVPPSLCSLTASCGYEPYKLMCVVIEKRLKDKRELRAVILSSLWLRFSDKPQCNLYNQLFVNYYPSMHHAFFSTLTTVDNSYIARNLYTFAAKLNSACHDYQHQDSIVKRMLRPIHLKCAPEDTLVRNMRRAHGIYDRDIHACNRVVLVKGTERKRWNYKWSDCILVYSDKKRIYERVDERIKWLSTLFIHTHLVIPPCLRQILNGRGN